MDVFVSSKLCFLLFLFTKSHGQLSGLQAGVERCPSHLNRGGNLVTFFNQCYDVVTYDPLSWEDARQSCLQNSGKLVEIADSVTVAFLRQYLSSLDGVGTGVWIGLQDRDKEGEFRWDSGPPLRFSHWGEGQPGGALGWVDDCVLMKLDGMWYDYACDVFFEHFSYVCQYDMSN